MSEAEEIPKPPGYAKLCLETPLYATIPLDNDRDADWLARLREGDVQIDCHCVECGRSSTFRTVRVATDGLTEAMRNKAAPRQIIRDAATNKIKSIAYSQGQFGLHLSCQRFESHVYSYYFQVTKAGLTKIGQTPSIEDVASEETDRLRPVLGSYYGELRRAGGLFAHGIGIGSFVYLRRVFEGLVEEHRQAAEQSGISLDGFEQMRMSEKVTALRAQLPSAVADNARAYSILSKGIHELSEQECRTFFPVLRRAIIMMLEQTFEARRRRLEEEEMRAEMTKIDEYLGSREQTVPDGA